MRHLPGARAHRRTLAALVLTSVVAAGCGGVRRDEPVDAYAGTLEALCQARDAEDRSTTEIAFFQGAHADLHELALEVREVAPDVAGGLLIVKSRVENLVRQDDVAHDEVRAAVDELLTVTRDALRRLDRPAPGC